jgi:hypothetical protein
VNFVNPHGLIFGLLAIPIIALYLLKIRRREFEISSTMLWRMVLRDRQANAPWQKLRRNLLLLLQLVILSGLVLAAARLAFPGAAIASGSVVLLLDGSASMLATDGDPTRFDQAVQVAQNIAEETSAGSEITAILVSHQPAILLAAEPDKNQVAAALENAAAGTGPADWPAAFALAAGIGSQASSGDLTFAIISDGGIPETGLPPLPGEVRFVPVGGQADNLAIEAFEARTLSGSGSGGAELFVRLHNYGSQSRTALLRISQDGAVILNRQVSVSPGEPVSLTLAAAESSKSAFLAELLNIEAGTPLDSFPTDDQAFTVTSLPSTRRVYLVSEGNVFLERLLLLLPNIVPLRLVPDSDGNFQLPEDGNGIFILDGLIPAGVLPPADLLILNPPENELFEVLGETETIGPATVSDHPLVDQLSWEGVHILKTKVIGLPAWGQVLAETDQTPLVFIGERSGQRLAVVGFDLHDSDLPLQVSFPILFSQLLAFLAPPQAVLNPNGSAPYDSVAIRPPPDMDAIRVTTPSGESQIFEAGGETIFFGQTAELGIYQVEISGPAGMDDEAFSVNLFNPSESDIAPRENIRVGQIPVSAAMESQVANREVWAWLLGFALAFMLVEWLAFHRRLGQPQPKLMR